MEGALILAGSALGVTAMLCFAGLRAWRGWLELRRFELARPGAQAEDVGLRIEVAAVRERLRKLEAIASGIEP